MVEQQTQTEFRLSPLEPMSSTCTKAFKITLLGGGCFNRASLAVSPKMEATQMEIFNFLWLTWDH